MNLDTARRGTIYEAQSFFNLNFQWKILRMFQNFLDVWASGGRLLEVTGLGS